MTNYIRWKSLRVYLCYYEKRGLIAKIDKQSSLDRHIRYLTEQAKVHDLEK